MLEIKIFLITCFSLYRNHLVIKKLIEKKRSFNNRAFFSEPVILCSLSSCVVLGVVGILSDEVVDLIDDAFEFVDCWDIEDIDLNDFVISPLRVAFSLSLQGRKFLTNPRRKSFWSNQLH